MNDLNHIGRPGASEERRIASARRRNMPLQLGASERGEATEDISGPGGLRKSLKRLNSDEEIQWKTGPFSWELFARAWPDLAEFWIRLGLGLGLFQHAQYGSVHANKPLRTQQRTLQAPEGEASRGALAKAVGRMPLARAAKCLKRLKTAMGSYWKKLAWIWVWRHVRLGSAPRPLGFGATSVWGGATRHAP